jgi:hypothetical protein
LENTSLPGAIMIILALAMAFKVTAVIAKVVLAIIGFFGLLLIVVPMLLTGG